MTLADPTCSSGPPLWPRDQGYVLSVTNNGATGGKDRLVAIGGESSDVNVFYSDDCGATWVCSVQPQAWIPRQYAAVLPTKGIFPGDPLFLAGGFTGIESVALFGSTDGGITWSRPACASSANCQNDCQSVPSGSECTLPVPDPVGSCDASNSNYNLC